MPAKTWTARQLAILKREYPYCAQPRDLAVKLGKTYEALKSKVTVLRLLRKVPNANKGRTIVTPADDQFLKENYQLLPAALMGRWLGYSETCIKGRYRQLGLKMSRKVIRQFVEMSLIQKGNVPANKGKKQTEYMSREAIAKTAKTRFKKGHKPQNTKYDGAITIIHTSVKRGSRPYKMIRLAEKKWEPLHVYKWKKKFGPVPPGHIIVFRDGNTMNVTLKNLQCITRKEHAANSRDSDGYIAMTLSHRRGTGGRCDIDWELYEKIKGNKELIELKRQSLKLKRTINEKR